MRARPSALALSAAMVVAAPFYGCDKSGDAAIDTGAPDTSAPSRDNGGPGGGPGSPGGPGGPGGPGDDSEPAAPAILRAASWCEQHTVGTKYWVWYVEAEAEDPQGNKTLLSVGSPARFYKEGELISEHQLVCSDEGYCFASWEETGAEPLCSIASQYLIEIQIADVDLNYSETVTVEPTRVE